MRLIESRISRVDRGVLLSIVWPLKDWPTSNHRGHWSINYRRSKAIKYAVTIVAASARAMAGPVATPARLTLSFGFPDARIRDLDNLDCKAFIDALVAGRLIPDDSTKHIVHVGREEDPARTPKGRIRVTATLTALASTGILQGES